MRKIRKFTILMMSLFALVACGNTSGGSNETPRVALLISKRGDMSFNDSAIRGVEKADQDFEVDVKVIEYGEETDKFETTFVDAAESGYDVIIVASDFVDYIERHSETYSNTTFIIFDAEVDYTNEKNKNVNSIVYSANEASYVGGYLSAKLSKTGVIGFLGGQEAPIINDFLVGYIQGAKDANPDIKVAVSFVGNYDDSSKGKELSLAMSNQQADMIFNVAGGAGVGLIEAAVETGIYVLGVDSDQAMIYDASGKTEFAETIPTSVMKNVDESLYRAIDLYLKNELNVGQKDTLGLKENGVGIANNKYYEEMVSQELRDEVDSLLEKIKNGEITVDTAYGKTTDDIKEIRDSVRP